MVFQFQLHTDNLNVPLPEEERGVNKEMYIWNRKSREERLRIVAHGQQVFGLAMLERLSAQGDRVSFGSISFLAWGWCIHNNLCSLVLKLEVDNF